MQFTKNLFFGVALALLSGNALAAEAKILGYPVPVQKDFKGWQVTCNNLNTCQLNNYADRFSYLYVILKRDAGVSGKVSLSLLLKPDQHVVYLDGAPFPLDAADWQVDSELDSDGKFYRYTTRLEVIQRFIQAARNAQQLTLVEPPVVQDEADGAVVSLSGLSAALLLADERQGRLKNRSALLNIGEGDVSQVPPVPTGQRVDITYHQPEPLSNGDALAAAVSKAHQSVLCEPDEGEKSSEKLEAFPLSGKLALVMRECSPGAYQGASDLFITPRSNPQAAKPVKLLALSISNAALVEMEEGPMNADYDPQTGLLSHTVYVGSVCGSGERAKWAFDGKAFQLVSEQFSNVCGQSKYWPSVWAMPGYPTE
ncbi:protein of unknown function DUF1176 [Dickeya chrysanthemi Ech1591]|uniref:DUF1176 domain-containing protein n=1 Tax=Dickeya chrysanthemi (strain Ech1591) TaxID=561229 RepID=C6CN88_DICC1|nr:DUF1176 domain-containing protein [Dickeya chrysanthemi]ACT08681.1 protein of unknown function DUF1176 [Dickeya chrysanthemi Ech1591]